VLSATSGDPDAARNYIPDLDEREAAFAYIYFLRSKGYLNSLASGTNWMFRDESCRMNLAFEVVNTVRVEQPHLFVDDLRSRIQTVMDEAIDCEYQFAEDLLGQGVPGMSTADTCTYLEFGADQRLAQLGLPKTYWLQEPVRLHGTPGRPGVGQLLRAHGRRLPGRCRGRRGLRQGLLGILRVRFPIRGTTATTQGQDASNGGNPNGDCHPGTGPQPRRIITGVVLHCPGKC
jgi:hypothetical protein